MNSKEERIVLLIAPKFYDYDKFIKNELATRCKSVYLKNEVPFNSSTLYYLFEKFSHKIRAIMWKDYEKKIKKIVFEKQINTVFIIRGELIPESIIRFFSDSGLEIIYYQWDSVKNNPNGLMIAKYAKQAFSFDMSDCEKYQCFNYLPLFYYWGNLSKTNKPIKKHYDIMFFGSWSIERFNVYNEIKELCNSSKKKLYAQLYMPFQSFFRRYIKGEKLPCKLLRFRSMSRKDYYMLLRSSDMIFDVPSKTQIGSSMRTIETLSLKKKLITTNTNVRKELFYHSDNILIWPQEKAYIDVFFQTVYNDISLTHICSLEKWLDNMGF